MKIAFSYSVFSSFRKGLKSAKAKNSKKAGDKSEKEKSGYHIPRKNPLLNADSDVESIGQGLSLPSNNVAKFLSNVNPIVSSMLKPKELLSPEFHSLCEDLNNLILYSSSKQTWAKHCSAWKMYSDFCAAYRVKFELPIKVEFARAFVTWAVAKKSLKSSTIKSYVSSLNIAHTVSNTASPNLSSDNCIKLAIKGAKNSVDPKLSPRPSRIPMSYDLLVILGHRIRGLNWGKYAKQVLWTACTTSFFSSCRMGEILPSSENCFDPDTTVLWENVVFSEEREIVIYVPYSKSTGFKGKFIDLYPVESNCICPSASLYRLRKMAASEGIWDQRKPVFSFKSGKFLTKAKLNSWLASLLNDFTDENNTITGHSFRAAIPSLLAANPDVGSIKDIKLWGGWASESYKMYTKNEKEKRRIVFSKIVHCLLNSKDE